MNLLDIVLKSKESQLFNQKFGGLFGGDVPTLKLIYRKGDDVCFIPEDESAETVLNLFKESLNCGKDLVFDKYKDNVFENNIPEDAII